MINPDNVFNLFSQSEDLEGVNEEVYIDYSDDPLYQLGMFKKTILNHINFNKKALQFLKDEHSDLDIEDIRTAGEFIVYNRAWRYIRGIDTDSDAFINTLKRYNDEFMDTSLKLGINFFEQEEEYERCALLKKILDKLKSL
jgi:hypothetical protein